MSLQYQAVGWNRQKRIYDSVLAGSVFAYLSLFVSLGAIVHPNATIETVLIRGFGTAALLLLHIILSIGPLCRLDRRFLPLLYNRRHLGVTMFLLALAHGSLAIAQFHGFGNTHPLVSVLISNRRYASLAEFPFQQLGFVALLILFVMAATSHDFWLRNLTAPVWKGLHMSVYLAYALLIAHVTLGALQSETSPVLAALLGIGLGVILILHVAAALRERSVDQREPPESDGFVEVCNVDSIPENRAVIVSVSGERVAVFRYDGKISALSNVCQHQNGPLGEGRIIDGCVTCPWHGYQYMPDSGASPPPFTEKVPTFRTRVVGGKVLLHPCPLAPGTRVEPARTTSASSTGERLEARP
jgi:methionine sulfoxide reductase heme-binding subunit